MFSVKQDLRHQYVYQADRFIEECDEESEQLKPLRMRFVQIVGKREIL